MFIKNARGGYKRDGEQWARGTFLVIINDATNDPCGNGVPFFKEESERRRLWSLVRTVHLSQCGHWMMGSIDIGGNRFGLSGTYGDDGLPCSLPPWLDRDSLVELPKELCDKFWAGGGHNCGGSEMGPLTEWALANEKALRRAGKAKV